LKQDEKHPLYAGRVCLEAKTGGPDSQPVCVDGYQVVINRCDGSPMSEMELRSLITNLSWAIDGQPCHIDLTRAG